MKAIDAPGAWVYRNQMQPVNVGVIDSIFYPDHEDLKDVFQEMPLGNASAMMNQGLSIWKGKWSGKGHATHVSGIIGADFDNGKGICGVAPNAKLYGVDWSDSPLYRTIDEKKPIFGDGSNMYCMKIAMLYLVVEKQCQVINIDATIINVPSSTKNAKKARDPEMHQTKKGNEWRFGMKCHIGVDAGSGLVHTMTVTAANEHDITETAKLLREDDDVMYGDSAYIGIQKRPEIKENAHFANIDFRINRRPRSLPRVSDNAIDWVRYIENRKSSVRCKVEHVFRIIKCQFGYRKVAYRGLKKNENRLYAMFACANLYALAIAGRKLSTT